jgi:shikimate dehydrogenase
MKLAVFGNPVTHSLSPQIHELFADQYGLQVDYRAIQATPESFPRLAAELAENGARGCNITAPLKHDAWKLAGRRSESASRARAVNTLVFFNPGEWYGDSTDGLGLVNDLQSITGFHLRDARLCLIGAGGAAASVLGALLLSKPETIVIVNRTRERAAKLAQEHSDLGRVDVCSPGELGSAAPFDLVINATSLGHDGEAPELPPSRLTPNGLCYDMNYGEAAEPLKQLCLKNGIQYSDGLGMLVRQAALSFKLWTDHAPDPTRVIRELRGTAG